MNTATPREPDAFAAEYGFDDCTDIGIEFPQDVHAALDLRYLYIKSREELCEFTGNRPTAEHDERLWQFGERERMIAGDVTDFFQRGQGRR